LQGEIPSAALLERITASIILGSTPLAAGDDRSRMNPCKQRDSDDPLVVRCGALGDMCW